MNATTSAPTMFDTFNARACDPELVAKTFVPSEHYSILAKPAHTQIVGPRGSGKTTLLKMLQPQALEAWQHPQADGYRAGIDYTGVFIPADRTWSDQMVALGSEMPNEAERKLLITAAFTTHVLRELVKTMDYRLHPPALDEYVPHRRVSLDRSGEATLITELARAWHIELRLPSLLAMKSALAVRLSRIWELASKESRLSGKGRSERLAVIDYLHVGFLQAAGYAVELFDDLTTGKPSKWALLFDELELVPGWICEQLFNCLRSVNDRFLFKLSISPFSDTFRQPLSGGAPSADNDYDKITLWYANKDKGFAFCRSLLQSMLKQRCIPAAEPVAILGQSEFETFREEYPDTLTAYRPGSRQQKRFVRLAAKDGSFARYLRERHIDPKHLDVVSSRARPSDIRKVTALVAVRDTFIASNRGGSSVRRALRSRKNPKLYAGARSLFAIVEGNPRWFIGIVGRLLDQLSDRGSVDPAKQTYEIGKAEARFRALLKTIPCPRLEMGSEPRGILTLLDKIGRYFTQAVILDDFNPDVPGSFVVDSHANPRLVASLGQALNAGAIVYVPDDGDSGEFLVSSLRGKRFRLSYLLAPSLKLPIRLGPSRSLSGILGSGVDRSLFENVE